MKIGTNHFVDRASAVRYYREYSHDPVGAVERKLASGEIKLGPPIIARGEVLGVTGSGTRYMIDKGDDYVDDAMVTLDHAKLAARIRASKWGGEWIVFRYGNHERWTVRGVTYSGDVRLLANDSTWIEVGRYVSHDITQLDWKERAPPHKVDSAVAYLRSWAKTRREGGFFDGAKRDDEIADLLSSQRTRIEELERVVFGEKSAYTILSDERDAAGFTSTISGTHMRKERHDKEESEICWLQTDHTRP